MRLRPLSAGLLVLLAAGFAGPAGATDVAPEPDAAASPELLWELDPYYSNVGLQFSLDNRPVPDGGTLSEVEVYRTLFRDSLRPRVLLLEASVYPLPAFGAWLRGNETDTYDDFVIGDLAGDELNVIEGLTAGYQEPWALSAFVGSELVFYREGDRKRRQNRGYMGYLLSCGKKHLHSNYLIDDDWCEVEWKLKGEREFRDEQLSWSFRVGLKEHGNPDIEDVAYLGFRRDNLDFRAPVMSFLRNSSIDLMTELSRTDGEFMRQEIIVGKKLPIRRWRFAPVLEIGVIVEQDSKYTGQLANLTDDDFTIVFRPNIDW